MTVLVDHQIKSLCEQGLVNPYDKSLINPSSLDIRLGNNLIVHIKGDGFFTRLWKKLRKREQDIVRPHHKTISISHCTKDNPYILEPNEFVLAETLEYLTVPTNIAIELKLKSSRAREGLSHALAGWVDNGFYGVLTLELKNYSTRKPVFIYPTLRIGQLIIHSTEEPTTPYQGKYSGFNTVMGSLDK